MKTKKLIIALVALGAFITSNAQTWEWSTPTPVTSSTALVRTGSISLTPTSNSGNGLSVTNNGINSFYLPTGAANTYYSLNTSGLNIGFTGYINNPISNVTLDSKGSMSVTSQYPTSNALSIGYTGGTGSYFNVLAGGATTIGTPTALSSLTVNGIATITGTETVGGLNTNGNILINTSNFKDLTCWSPQPFRINGTFTDPLTQSDINEFYIGQNNTTNQPYTYLQGQSNGNSGQQTEIRLNPIGGLVSVGSNFQLGTDQAHLTQNFTMGYNGTFKIDALGAVGGGGRFSIDMNGNTGIGLAPTATYKLAVNGGIFGNTLTTQGAATVGGLTANSNILINNNSNISDLSCWAAQAFKIVGAFTNPQQESDKNYFLIGQDNTKPQPYTYLQGQGNNHGQQTEIQLNPLGGQVSVGTGNFNIDKYVSGAASIPGGRLSIDINGNVGIGITPTATYKLAVNGGIAATSVKVELPSGGVFPDYVFKKDYKLRSLKEVEAYVTTNSHLPEVPSNAEVAKDGLDVMTMNATLLKKVEELTLYMIQQQKEIEALKVLVNSNK